MELGTGAGEGGEGAALRDGAGFVTAHAHLRPAPHLLAVQVEVTQLCALLHLHGLGHAL